MTTKFKTGQEVNIINQSMGGTYFIEDRARVVKPISVEDYRYYVSFNDDYGPVERL